MPSWPALLGFGKLFGLLLGLSLASWVPSWPYVYFLGAFFGVCYLLGCQEVQVTEAQEGRTRSLHKAKKEPRSKEAKAEDERTRSLNHAFLGPLLLTYWVPSWTCADVQAVNKRPTRQIKKSVQDLAVYTT